MLRECDFCGKEFLTEADPYIVIPTKYHALSCGCKIELFHQYKKTTNELKSSPEETIAILKSKLDRCMTALREMNFYVKLNHINAKEYGERLDKVLKEG